jgi:hypothetical protein
VIGANTNRSDAVRSARAFVASAAAAATPLLGFWLLRYVLQRSGGVGAAWDELALAFLLVGMILRANVLSRAFPRANLRAAVVGLAYLLLVLPGLFFLGLFFEFHCKPKFTALVLFTL